MSIKRWFKEVMAKLGWTPTADCAAESATQDKRLSERQDQLDEAIDQRDTARTLAELLRGDVARLERQLETEQEFRGYEKTIGINLEYATNNIWTMEDKPGYIGLRLDSGDSGAIYFTKDQAALVIACLAPHLCADRFAFKINRWLKGAKLERERDEALIAAEIHQANKELWQNKFKQKGVRTKTQELASGRGTVRPVAKRRKTA